MSLIRAANSRPSDNRTDVDKTHSSAAWANGLHHDGSRWRDEGAGTISRLARTEAVERLAHVSRLLQLGPFWPRQSCADWLAASRSLSVKLAGWGSNIKSFEKEISGCRSWRLAARWRKHKIKRRPTSVEFVRDPIRAYSGLTLQWLGKQANVLINAATNLYKQSEIIDDSFAMRE